MSSEPTNREIFDLLQEHAAKSEKRFEKSDGRSEEIFNLLQEHVAKSDQHFVGIDKRFEKNEKRSQEIFDLLQQHIAKSDQQFARFDKRFEKNEKHSEEILDLLHTHISYTDKRFDQVIEMIHHTSASIGQNINQTRQELGDLIRKEDRKLVTLVHILEDKKILTGEEALRVL